MRRSRYVTICYNVCCNIYCFVYICDIIKLENKKGETMLLELAKKLNFIDNDLALSISASKDGRFTFGVYSYMLGDLYTYQSTSVEECYKKVLEFAD